MPAQRFQSLTQIVTAVKTHSNHYEYAGSVNNHTDNITHL